VAAVLFRSDVQDAQMRLVKPWMAHQADLNKIARGREQGGRAAFDVQDARMPQRQDA